ncbi:hypothetical protein Tco_1302725 [Tanacetum coccineum]
MEGESLTSVYERFSTLINVMDQNDVRPPDISINTRFLNSLKPEWSKYVTMTCQKYTLKTTEFDLLFDHLSQFEPHVYASKAKKSARNHDPLALVANSHAHSSNSHASSSYSHLPQPYYVTHPSSLSLNVTDEVQSQPPELQRSWCVEGHIRFGVISSVLMQRYQRTTRQKLGDEGLSSGGTKLNSGAETRDVETETHGGPTEPVLQTQKTPSPSLTFIKENIDVLRTMIKEHDQQAMVKAPRRLAYADSDKKALSRYLARGFSDRFSLEPFGTSDTYKKTRSARQSQRTPSKNKEPSQLRRPRRLEDRITTKEKARREMSKPRGKRYGHQETSTDSEHEEGSEDTYEDLNLPYKRPKPTPFTQRITRFKYHRRAELPRNIRVYEGNKDPEDHLGIFSAAAEQEE